jgi:CBS domain-containing protein
MNRRDTHLDAMLRHLGAAYYDSLHGRAAPADVTRALDRVTEQIGDHQTRAAGRRSVATGQQPGGRPQHHGRWHSRVRDVMTTSVVTVDRITSYKEIVSKLAEHQVSGLPVLVMGRRVVGVVCEGDLIAARDRRRSPGQGRWLPWRKGGEQHQYLTAEQLMTSPAVTIHPDATISAAARLMNARHVRRLPVVDQDGKLIGIVSRRDLLSLFLRPDAAIARQVHELLAEILPAGSSGIEVGVHGGVVTLTRKPDAAADGEDLLPVAVRLAWDIDGVVDVVEKTGSASRAAAQSGGITGLVGGQT